MPHKAGRHDGSICGAMAVARKMTPLPSACASTDSTRLFAGLRCRTIKYAFYSHTHVHTRSYPAGSCARPPRMLLTPAGCIALQRELLGRASARASLGRSRLCPRIALCCRSMRRCTWSRALSGQRKDRIGANAVRCSARQPGQPPSSVASTSVRPSVHPSIWRHLSVRPFVHSSGVDNRPP